MGTNERHLEMDAISSQLNQRRGGTRLRRMAPPVVSGRSWLISFTDLLTVLLAFFALLVAISAPDKNKIVDVVESLRLQFGRGIEGLGINTSFVVSRQQHLGSGTSLQDVAGLFAHEVPGLRPTYVRSTGTLTLTIPASDLNAFLGLSGERKIDPHLQELAGYLRGTAEQRYDVLLLLNRRPALMADDNAQPDVTDVYLPVWAAGLMQLGVPSASLSYGIAPGRPGTVSLVIRPVEGGAP